MPLRNWYWNVHKGYEFNSRLLCRHWESTVLASATCNFMSSVPGIPTWFSSLPHVVTKTHSFLTTTSMSWVYLLFRPDAAFPFLRFLAAECETQKGLSHSVGGTKDCKLNPRHTDRLRKGAADCNLLNFLRKSSIASQPNVSVCPSSSCLYYSLWKKQDVGILRTFYMCSWVAQCTNKPCRCFVIRVISHDQSYIVLLSMAAI